ncbi:hypothetical protein A2U01_0047941, partial [Trifolium medium]|nr:hypothetical protein [Trifolium medium]
KNTVKLERFLQK